MREHDRDSYSNILVMANNKGDHQLGLKQIQQRKQEEPHEIDKVPIQPNIFNDVSLVLSKRIHSNDEHKSQQTYSHVYRMESGKQKVVLAHMFPLGIINRKDRRGTSWLSFKPCSA